MKIESEYILKVLVLLSFDSDTCEWVDWLQRHLLEIALIAVLLVSSEKSIPWANERQQHELSRDSESETKHTNCTQMEGETRSPHECERDEATLNAPIAWNALLCDVWALFARQRRPEKRDDDEKQSQKQNWKQCVFVDDKVKVCLFTLSQSRTRQIFPKRWWYKN